MLGRHLDTGVCRAAKYSSRGFPAILSVLKWDVGKVPSYFTVGHILEEVGILFWFDNALVSLITTIHHLIGEDYGVMKNLK